MPNHPLVGVVGFSDLPKSGLFKDTRGRIGVSECVRIDRTDDCILERTSNHLRYGIRGQSLPPECRSDGVSDLDYTVRRRRPLEPPETDQRAYMRVNKEQRTPRVPIGVLRVRRAQNGKCLRETGPIVCDGDAEQRLERTPTVDRRSQ